MKINLTGFFVPKAGEELESCADSLSVNTLNMAFAVSDGVTQSLYPAIWSRILTSEYVKSPQTFFVTGPQGKTVKPALADNFERKFQEKYNSLEPQKRRIVDISRKKKPFSAATFIGLWIKNNTIHIDTIGDSVVFVFDKRTKTVSVICSMSENGVLKFDNMPEYITSQNTQKGRIVSADVPLSESIILVMTDALSDWYNSQTDKFTITQNLTKITTHDAFQSLVNNLRAGRALKDDDTTMLVLDVQEDISSKIIINKIHVDEFKTDGQMDVEKEIKRLNASLTDINSKMSVLERKIDSMPTQTVVKTDNSVVNDSIRNINSKISLLERKLESIPNRDINNLDRDNNAISKLIEQYNALKNEIASIKEQINKSVTNQPARVVPNPSIDVQLKNNLNLLGKRIDDLEKKITSSTNQPTPIISHGNEGTEQFKKDFNDKLDEIKHRLSIIESNVKSSIDMQNQLQKLQEECKKLSNNNEEIRAENNVLKHQIKNIESEFHEWKKKSFWQKIFSALSL